MRKRLPAEWEVQSAVQITFPHADSDWAAQLDTVIPCFVEIIEQICRFQQVLVVCQNKENVTPYLANCPSERLILVEIPSNDTWARDHGGISIFQDGQVVLYDFFFNGWGLKFAADKDNLITQQLYHFGIFKTKHFFRPRFVLEGGSIESDGQGTLLTTSQCLLSPNRNPHLNQKEIEDKLKGMFGLQQVLWLHHGYLEGDDTDAHIDTLARFCNLHTIAYVHCDDSEDVHYPALKRMEEEIKSFRKLDGSPYQLQPLPWPGAIYNEEGQRLPATYANFLIINEAVLVPFYNVPQDKQALEIFQKIFPNRAVIGINCRPLIQQNGSLHCVTMQYPKGLI